MSDGQRPPRSGRAGLRPVQARQRAARRRRLRRRSRPAGAASRWSPRRPRSVRPSAGRTSAGGASGRRRGVRGGGRALARERLRALLPGPALVKTGRLREARHTRRSPPGAPGPRGLPRPRDVARGRPARTRPGGAYQSARDAGLAQMRLADPRPECSRTATAPSTTRPSRRSRLASSTAAAARSPCTHTSCPPCRRTASKRVGGSTRAASRGRCPRGLERMGLGVRTPSASRSPTSSGQPAACSPRTVTPHSPWATRRPPREGLQVAVDVSTAAIAPRVRSAA